MAFSLPPFSPSSPVNRWFTALAMTGVVTFSGCSDAEEPLEDESETVGSEVLLIESSDEEETEGDETGPGDDVVSDGSVDPEQNQEVHESWVDLYEEVECEDEDKEPDNAVLAPECSGYEVCMQEKCPVEYENAFGDALDGQAGGSCKEYIVCSAECCGDQVCIDSCLVSDACYIASLSMYLCGDLNCPDDSTECLGDNPGELPLPEVEPAGPGGEFGVSFRSVEIR